MSNVLLLTSGREPPADILPSLSLLPHTVRVAPVAAEHVISGPVPDAVLVDARRDLVLAKRVLLALRVAATSVPVIAVVTDGGWAAVSADWGADDLLLHTAGPGEVEARLRLAIGRRTQTTTQLPDEIRSGGLVVNEATYSARMSGRSLDLTFKEFELLKFLAQHPGRVFTRAQLLQEVWGYDYFGGTRTVDVHVRRLRAKLGAENEALIGTVRNVGYRFVPGKSGVVRADGEVSEAPRSEDVTPDVPDDGAREDLAEGRRSGGRSDVTASFRGSNASRETAGPLDGRPSGRDAADLRSVPAGSLPSVAHADS